MAALTAKQLTLADQARGKAARDRSPQEQAALEAARAAGIGGYRSPGTTMAGQVAAANQLDPQTGLRRGIRPNVPLTGTFRGVPLPRGGIDVSAPSQHWLGRLQKKNPNLYKRLTADQQDTSALAELARENPRLFEQYRRSTQGNEFRGYGAEQGIYGRGGYQGWMKQWNENPVWKQLGMGPMTPEQWAKFVGYTGPENFTEAERKGMRKRYGNVPWLAGSMPLDVVPHDDESKLRVLNKVYGTSYKTLDEAAGAMDPALLWNNLTTEQKRLKWAQGGGGFDGSTPDFIREAALLGANQGARGPFETLFNTIFARGPKAIGRARDLYEQAAGATPDWFRQTIDRLKGMQVQERDRETGELKSRTLGDASLWPVLSSFLGDPLVNLTDPSKPLFSNYKFGSNATALGSPEGGLWGQWADFGANTVPYLASLNANEFLNELLPLWYRSHYDAPTRETAEEPGQWLNPTYAAGRGSPVDELPSYQRWMAYGRPGSDSVIDLNGRFGFKGGGTFVPAVAQVASGRGVGWVPGQPMSIFEQNQGLWNQMPPEVQGNTYTFADGTTGVILNRQPPGAYWQLPANQAYAPWQMDPQTLARLRQLAQGT